MNIYEKLNIDIKKDIYQNALTHSSYANEVGTKDYERLEYLGDAILEFLTSDYLYNNTDKLEGEMTKTRAHYVCEDALYAYATEIKLNDYILLGKGEEESGGRNRKAIVSDIYEAFLAAIYLDKGIDVARDFVYLTAIPHIKNNDLTFIRDYKSKLQELVQTDKRSLEYKLVNEEGPSHNKTFTVEVKIDDNIYGKGIGHSKKEAEQEAAKAAIEKSAHL